MKTILAVLLLGLALAFSLPLQEAPNHSDPVPPKWKYAGMTFVNDRYCPNVTFGSEKARMSLEHLASTGTNWVAIVVGQYQMKFNSYDIFPVHEPIHKEYYTHITATDEDLRSIVQYAHELGFQVMLKPHIDLIDDSNGQWRGSIGTNFTRDEWDRWFDSYGNFLLHYAKMAEELGAEMFCVSCELIEASKQEQHWRELVAKVRELYSGPLTSAANWWNLNGGGGEGWDKKWWDLMDIIGVDAYWNLHDCGTQEQCVQEWQPVIAEMEELVAKWNKPLMLTEAGSCSGLCRRNRQPSPADRVFQAGRYEGTFEAFRDKPWFHGVFWWSWNTDPASGGPDCDCITPQYKQAESVIRKYYHADSLDIPKMPDFEAQCICTV